MQELGGHVEREFETVAADVLVVGGGGAACRAAIEAGKTSRCVIAVDGVFGRAGTTTTGMGGMNVALGNFDSRDNWEVHYEDTIKGGQFINNQELVEIFSKEGLERIYDLEQYGMLFHRMDNGRIAQRRESGSTYHRTCMTGDRTGHELQRTLTREVQRRRIPVFEEVVVAALLVEDGSVAGALGLDFRSGRFLVFRAPAVVMATGGCVRLYEICSNAHESTGDGVGMAHRAGAALIDMEMVQFHPTGMVFPESGKGLLVSEAVRGDGGQLINSEGERFMTRYSPDWMELATRDVVARAIWSEVTQGRGSPHGGVYLDISHVPAQEIEVRLPLMLRQLLRTGIDIRKEAMEVLPTPHFMCGGIRIDAEAATTLPGLFAGGETAGGVHGANRLGANSFTDLQVFGARAGRSAAYYAAGQQRKASASQVKHLVAELSAPLDRAEGTSPISLRKRLQKLMYQSVGIVRNRQGLESARTELMGMKTDGIPVMSVAGSPRYNYALVESIKIRNMVETALAIAECALKREESRGVHFREDFPQQDPSWLANIIVSRCGSEMRTEVVEVVASSTHPVVASTA